MKKSKLNMEDASALRRRAEEQFDIHMSVGSLLQHYRALAKSY